MTRECGLLEQIVIAFIMLPNIVGRALCLGVIFGLMKIYGAIVLLIVCASQILISYLESLINKSKITPKMFLGILTSFTSPCLIVIEQSKHFLINGISGSILNIVATWCIYLIVSKYGNIFSTEAPAPFILECHHNFTTKNTTRCVKNPNTTDDCLSGFFQVSNPFNETLFTNCPESISKWHLLWITSCIVTALMLLSLVSIVFLHYLINVEKRMSLFWKIGIDTCPERDASIKQFIIDIMDGKDFEDVNKEAKEVNGKPILELMVQSRRIHLTKVNVYFSCNYQAIFLYFSFVVEIVEGIQS